MSEQGVLIDLSFFVDLLQEIVERVSSLASWFALSLASKYFYYHKKRPIVSFIDIALSVCEEAESGSASFFLATIGSSLLLGNLHLAARTGKADFVEAILEATEYKEISSYVIFELARHPSCDPLVSRLLPKEVPAVANSKELVFPRFQLAGFIRANRTELFEQRVDELKAFTDIHWALAFGISRYNYQFALDDMVSVPARTSTWLITYVISNRSDTFSYDDVRRYLLADAVRLRDVKVFKALHTLLGSPKLDEIVLGSVCRCDDVELFLYTRDFSRDRQNGSRYHLVKFMEYAVEECAFKVMDHLMKVDEVVMQPHYYREPVWLSRYSRPNTMLYVWKELRKRKYRFAYSRPNQQMILFAPEPILEDLFEDGWRPTLEEVLYSTNWRQRYQDRLKFLLRKGAPKSVELFKKVLDRKARVEYLRELLELGVPADSSCYLEGNPPHPCSVERFRLLQSLKIPLKEMHHFSMFIAWKHYSNAILGEIHRAMVSSGLVLPPHYFSQTLTTLSNLGDITFLKSRLHFLVQEAGLKPHSDLFMTVILSGLGSHDPSSRDGKGHVELLDLLVELGAPFPPPNDFWKTLVNSSERRQAKFYSEAAMMAVLDWCHAKLPLPDPPLTWMNLLLTKNKKSFAFFPNDRVLVRFFIKCGLQLTDEERDKYCLHM